MKKTKIYFKRLIIHSWHYVIMLYLILFSFYQTTTSEYITSSFITSKPIKAHVAISKPAFHQRAYSDWAKVVYDTPVNLTDTTFLQHNKFSAWYKIQFEQLPPNSALNFFQYETVVGFDEYGQELARRTFETGRNLNNHKRNLVFDLHDTPQYKTYYFKVFARKWLANDTLQIRLEDRTALDNNLYRDFYNNQNIIFWLIFVFGIGVFQIIYIGSLAWSRRKVEYYYYLAFSIVGLYYIYIARRFELGQLGDWKYLITSSILTYLVLLIFFYARFVRYYLDTKQLSPFIDQEFRKGEWFMLVGTVINLAIYLFTNDLTYTFCFFIPFTTIVIIITLYLLILVYQLKTPLLKYLMFGAAFMVIMTAFSFIYKYLEQMGIISKGIEIDAFGGILGGVIDAVCLNLGLNYKHRLENIEKQRALETIRNSIASDLHDDLGSGLSTIRVMSEMAKTGIVQPEKRHQIERIAQQANDLIERMATIIWAMNTRNDTVESLIHYLHSYATDFLETVDINCHFPIPNLHPSVSQKIIVGETRRQLFFMVKEVLNNVLKHAEATSVTITIHLTENGLEIHIMDNGKGFDYCDTEGGIEPINPKSSPRKGNGGNGLPNLKERMKAIGGTFHIFSEKGKGTTVILSMPINKS